MKSTERRPLRARTFRIIDIALLLWAVLWIGLGIFTALEINNLTSLSDTLVKTGSSISQTGDALHMLAAVPFVGGEIGGFVNKINSAGADIQTSGHESRSTLQRLSWVIGFTLGVLPPLFMLALYLPVRRSWRRTVRGVRAGLARGDPTFEEYLARRAIDNLSYDSLRQISDNPWREVAAGEFGALADAELARLGITRPPARS